MYTSTDMLDLNNLGLKLDNNQVRIIDPERLASPKLDELVYLAVFGDLETRLQLRYIIGETARLRKIYLSSISPLYLARGRGILPDNFTTPALNLRGMVYDAAYAIFLAMKAQKAGAVIFELAPSEMRYTNQSPEEYATVILASALRAGYQGPVFLQADHTQLRAKEPGVAEYGEWQRLTTHIDRVLRAGFYNIDVDASTLVDLTQKDLLSQQRANIDWTGRLGKYIRENEPVGIETTLGGELGHIGGKNSTVEELVVFAEAINTNLAPYTGLAKVSVQTGTSHGGVVGSKGEILKMSVDFDLLQKITEKAKTYAIGGSVQHGASTLPLSSFGEFPKHKTLEIHLATGWQNIILDHPAFPKALRKEMYSSLLNNYKKGKESEAQYLYKQRKTLFGSHKRKFWDLDEAVKSQIRDSIQTQAEKIIEALKASNTLDLVSKYSLSSKYKKTPQDYVGS